MYIKEFEDIIRERLNYIQYDEYSNIYIYYIDNNMDIDIEYLWVIKYLKKESTIPVQEYEILDPIIKEWVYDNIKIRNK